MFNLSSVEQFNKQNGRTIAHTSDERLGESYVGSFIVLTTETQSHRENKTQAFLLSASVRLRCFEHYVSLLVVRNVA